VENFAGKSNVTFPHDEQWADSISHVEVIRSGFDEKLEINPNHLQLLYQGVLDRDTSGKPYGQIPWRLGLLELK
jgi:endo-1,4-beta-xylanase